MANAIWTYPWDLFDIGLEKVSAEIRDLGLDMISLAAVYHAGRFLQVRSPERRAYFPQDGACYFHPDQALWQGQQIQPIAADILQQGDPLRQLVAARDKGGLQVAAWTVCLHNSALGARHPDLVTRNAWGDPNYYNLCPAQPAAQHYVATLVCDISNNVRPDRIELESPNFLGFAHGHHHEKDMVGLPPEGDFLMSLCFCDACTAAATAQGIDVPQVQQQVRDMVDEICASEVPARFVPGFESKGPAAFEPELRAYCDLRFQHVGDLLQQAAAACHDDVTLMLIDGQPGWLGGCDHQAIAEMGISLLLCAYDQSDDEVTALFDVARQLPPERRGQIGLRLAHPEFANAAAFRHRLALLRRLGAAGFNLYNYGLVPKARLQWLQGAL